VANWIDLFKTLINQMVNFSKVLNQPMINIFQTPGATKGNLKQK